MASLEIARLWKLHKIDSGILDIRKRAAALDVGQKVQAELDKLATEEAEVGGKAKALVAEQLDIELQQKTIQDKIKKFEKDIYGGKLMSPREIQDTEKEIEMLKKQRDQKDERLLELWEVIPPAKEAAAEVAKRVEVKKAELAQRRKAAMETKTALEKEFAKLSKERPEAVKVVQSALLNRYEGVRSKLGTGMAEVVKGRSCSGCGTLLPERTLQALKEDKVVACEACMRVLYSTEGLI